MIAWFLIIIGLVLVTVGGRSMAKGVKSLKRTPSEFDRSIPVYQGQIMAGVIGVFAGLLPLALGIGGLFRP
jgi:uncharacterized membrane protein YfcA